METSDINLNQVKLEQSVCIAASNQYGLRALEDNTGCYAIEKIRQFTQF